MTIFQYTIKQVIRNILILLMLVVFLLLGSSNVVMAFADTRNDTSDVLDDLQIDSNFNVENYPYISLSDATSRNDDEDYNNDVNLLQVIQIAETKDKQLLIYTYQPSKNEYFNFDVTSINFSTTINENADYSKYELVHLSSNGRFDKYLVEDFEVSEDAIRYYEISEINRRYDSSIDSGNNGYANVVDPDIGHDQGGSGLEEPDNNSSSSSENNNNSSSSNNGVTIDEYAYQVAQQWTATTYSDGVKYTMKTIDVIVFTNQYAGTIRYLNGFYLITREYVDSHFFAFDTDKKIDDLLEIQMTYKLNHEVYMSVNSVVTKDTTTTETINKTIYCDEMTSVKTGLFRDTASWERILSVEDYYKQMEENDTSLDESSKTEIDKCKWVVSIDETDYTDTWIPRNDTLGISEQTHTDRYYVTEIDVLRLKFITDGVVYNLGVVANTISPDDIIDGIGNNGLDLSNVEEWFEKIVMLVGILILVIILGYLAPIFKIIVNLLSNCIKWALKGVGIVITAPFKLIGSLFKTKRKR